jgi:hypothetical protein
MPLAVVLEITQVRQEFQVVVVELQQQELALKQVVRVGED